ncbi:MAG: urease accessory protein UreH domain-containing protein [Bdellovibrionota bacterium]
MDHQLSIGLCFLLGAMHALEPGHGKTALAAHLLGEKGLLRPAIAAFSTALSHSLSILLIATAVHGALDLSLSEEGGTNLFRYLNLASGLVMVSVGAWLFFSKRAGKGIRHNHGLSCGCGHQPREDLPMLPMPSRSVRKSLNTMVLGFAVGLVPCPTALVALSQAIVGHDWITVGVVTFTFSAGIFFGLLVVGGILGLKVAPRVLSSSLFRGSSHRIALMQAIVVFTTGAWHIFKGL